MKNDIKPGFGPRGTFGLSNQIAKDVPVAVSPALKTSVPRTAAVKAVMPVSAPSRLTPMAAPSRLTRMNAFANLPALVSPVSQGVSAPGHASGGPSVTKASPKPVTTHAAPKSGAKDAGKGPGKPAMPKTRQTGLQTKHVLGVEKGC